jgi:hypothetical protein
MNNSNIKVYFSGFQGESDYQLYFSIGLMVLWQNAKKHQNCVDGGGTCWLQVTTILAGINLPTHKTPFQSSRIILILEYMI